MKKGKKFLVSLMSSILIVGMAYSAKAEHPYDIGVLRKSLLKPESLNELSWENMAWIGIDHACKLLESLAASHLPPDTDPKLEKIAILYKQCKKTTNEEIDAFINQYNAKIDSIRDEKSALDALEELQLDLGCIYRLSKCWDQATFELKELSIKEKQSEKEIYDLNPIWDKNSRSSPNKCIEMIDLEDNEYDHAGTDVHTIQNKLVEFIGKTSGLRPSEYNFTDFYSCSYSIERFGKLLKNMETTEGLNKIKVKLKETVAEFTNKLKANLKNIREFKNEKHIDSEDKADIMGFLGSHIGDEFYKVMKEELLKREFANSSELVNINAVVNECAEEVREACKREINSNDKFSVSSKGKICAELDKICVNSSKFDEYTNSLPDNLPNIGDNFMQNLVNLHRGQVGLLRNLPDGENGSVENALKRQAILGQLNIFNCSLELGIYQRYFELSGRCKNIDGLRYINNSLDELLMYKKIAELSELKAFNLSEKEIFKLLIRALLSHEFGHAIDMICGTYRFDTVGVVELGEGEKEYLTSTKTQLKEYVNNTGIVKPLLFDDEVFADYWKYVIFHNIVQKDNYTNEKILPMLKIMSLGFIADLGLQDGDHPPLEIRCGGLLGHFDWFYDLVQDASKFDFCVDQEKRIHF